MADRDFSEGIRLNPNSHIGAVMMPMPDNWIAGVRIGNIPTYGTNNNVDFSSCININANVQQPVVFMASGTFQETFPNETKYYLADIPLIDRSTRDIAMYIRMGVQKTSSSSWVLFTEMCNSDFTLKPNFIYGTPPNDYWVYPTLTAPFASNSPFLYPGISCALYQNRYLMFMTQSYQSNAQGTPWSAYYYICIDMERVELLYGVNAEIEKKYYSEAYGDASAEGGYTGGSFDDSSDTIGIPATPQLGVTSAGFVNVYNPSAGALQNLGSELFPDLSFTPDAPISGTGGVTEAIEAMATALVNFGNQIPNIVNMYINSNLIQYVIDCHILPVAPAVGISENIKIGFKSFTPSAPRVTSDYVDFDCGTLSIAEYYANFIDYAPYTRAKLFLPFVGFVDLAPEYWQSGNINIVYRFNIIDGSFMAFVKSTSSKSKLSNSVIAQYGGNACVHIPLTGLNYSSMVSGVVSAAAAVVSAQSGVQAATRAIGGAVDVMNSKPPVQQSNGYNATTSFLGVRTPYLIIERSVSNFSASYASEKGIPSNISTSFASLHGFTTAEGIHLDGITGATESELNEIARLLAEGVIL